MSVLPIELRNKLERTIIEAREVAEAGAKAALKALAAHYHEPYVHMSSEERKLRNHLRARARQLGDKQNRKGELEITHLVWECAYEHWHRMIFARFLAENELLIETEMGVAISLEECEELAKEDGKDLWALASEFAQKMLPQIFRPNDPVLKIIFAREHRMKLENLLNDLEPTIFTASDSLGWVYQFWQSKRKKEVNRSGNKIGPDELPAVTQLFTEPYMVSFLLDNSLGAWWAGRRLTEADFQNAKNEDELRKRASLPGVLLEYLRFARQNDGKWTPVAGTFDSWPENLSDLKTLDPCCGSGHFLVAAFLMLVPMRMELEELSAHDACDAVLRENLHGLEIDKRCVELAAFALALAAWRYPGAGGYRPLSELNLACSGLKTSANKDEWLALAGDNNNLHIALEELYKQFKDAPVLGSLINPEASLGKGSLFKLKWEEVGPLLTKALAGEKDDERSEMGVVALGLTKAADLLAKKYDCLFTNPPYLGERKQEKNLRDFSGNTFNEGKADLAMTFLLRGEEYVGNHTQCLVVPQNWLYQRSYKSLRLKLLDNNRIRVINQLGSGAFASQIGADVLLIVLSAGSEHFYGIDLTDRNGPEEKSKDSACTLILNLNAEKISNHSDARISLQERDLNIGLLEKKASCYAGILNGDTPRFICKFWEVNKCGDKWSFLQSTLKQTSFFGGQSNVILWENGTGQLRALAIELKERLHDADRRGNQAWGKNGITISQMGGLPASLYQGNYFDSNVAVISPKENSLVLPIWAYCESIQFHDEIRKIDKKKNVTNATLVKVPFYLDHWSKVAEEKYPNGLPKPYSDDPTQWIFHGHPFGSVVWNEEKKWTFHSPLRGNDTVLQVAGARLLGYRWPAELDSSLELADEQREWVSKCNDILKYTDEDGIVCIPSVRGEETADSRLRALLAAAFGNDWSATIEQELIRTTGVNASNLDEWLYDHFFEQHCKLFHHRPFIWHIWDGRRRDGFHALVNYHKLAEGNGKGRQILENLTYSYLGDWINRQKEAVKRGEGGAEDRLTAASELQKRLIAIIEGEPPFDIFVRWKPIYEQPIGWEPDINDGVRLNIRPFLAQDIPGGRTGAGILRWKPNINWGKDRGKEPFRPMEQYPWFWKDGEFIGDRVNSVHLTNEKKRQAHERMKVVR